jgi:hypothetical protein
MDSHTKTALSDAHCGQSASSESNLLPEREEHYDPAPGHLIASSAPGGLATLAGNIGVIRHASDGGVTWATQNSGMTQTLRGVSFPDANTGWVVGASGATA